LGVGLFLRKGLFWKIPNFGVRAIDGKKVACRKRRKRIMQEEKKLGTQEGNPNHDRVRVVDKYCNSYKFVK